MSGLLPRLLVGLLAMLGRRPRRPRCCAAKAGVASARCSAAVLGFAAVVVFDALRGWRLLRWLRGAQDTPAPRDAGFWGEIGYRIERSLRGLARTAEAERRAWRSSCRRWRRRRTACCCSTRSDQIEWCNSRAADHFGLDPQRDRRQRVTNLIRSPAFVAYLQAGAVRRAGHLPPAARPGHAAGDDPPLRRRPRSSSCRRT